MAHKPPHGKTRRPATDGVSHSKTRRPAKSDVLGWVTAVGTVILVVLGLLQQFLH